MEVPGKHTALLHQHIQECIAGDVLVIAGGVADGHAEGDAIRAHQVHRRQRLGIMSVSAAGIVGILKAFDADGHHEIAHAQQVLTELIIDQRAIGESVESHILMLFTQAQNVLLAHQRLAASEQAGVQAQLLAFGQHFVHYFVGQILLMAVLRCPAARTAHVAGGGRVHQHQPWDVAAILRSGLLRGLIAAKATLIGRVQQECGHNLGIHVLDDVIGVARPFAVGVGSDGAQHIIAFLFP